MWPWEEAPLTYSSQGGMLIAHITNCLLPSYCSDRYPEHLRPGLADLHLLVGRWRLGGGGVGDRISLCQIGALLRPPRRPPHGQDAYTFTVGASFFARNKIMACNTSGDDFIHLKTSHIKSRVILWNYSPFGSYSWENMLKFFLSKYI